MCASDYKRKKPHREKKKKIIKNSTSSCRANIAQKSKHSGYCSCNYMLLLRC